jgi:hypothetical protein
LTHGLIARVAASTSDWGDVSGNSSSGTARTKTRSIAANWAGVNLWIAASRALLPLGAAAAAPDAPANAASAGAQATTQQTGPA